MDIVRELQHVPKDGEQGRSVSDAMTGLLGKSATDPDFRQVLLEDGRRGIEEYTGGHLPEDLSIRFVEKRGDATIVLPPFMPAEELSEEDLEAVAGGITPTTTWGIAITAIEFIGATAGLAVAIHAALDGN